MTTFERLVKDARYALNSLSRDLVYECYGASKMAFNLGAITKEEFYQLNETLIRDGLNNYRNIKLH